MADIGSDFLTFLKAYYQEDYAKLSSGSVDDSLINSILNKHQSKFDTWLKVPERIRDEYFGRVPDDILNAAKTDNNLTFDECRDIENNRTIPSPSSIINNNDATKNLSFNPDELKSCRNIAKNLIAKKKYDEKTACIVAAGIKLSKKLDDIRTSKDTPKAVKNMVNVAKNILRKSYITIDRNFSKKHKPEIAILDLAQSINRGKIDSEKALPMMDTLMKKVKEKGREDELNELLKTSRYKVLKPENKILIDELMKSHDIGTIAQSLNKIKSKTKSKPTANITLPSAPTHETSVNSQILQNATTKQGR